LLQTGGAPDKDGNSITKSRQEFFIPVLNSDIDKITAADRMVIRLRMSTGKDDTSIAKINAKQKVRIGLGVKAKL
jgi:hypothetical protein